MLLEFKNAKISGVLTIVPKNVVKFDDEVENYTFSPKQTMKLKKIMGYDERRIAPEGVCTSDLCEYGIKYLFENQLLKKDDIDALILVTQSPDYYMPATSNILHGKLGLKEDVVCMDINQGCCGYIIGLIQSFMLLEQPSIRKVVLLNGDVLSPKISKQDRNSCPIAGDGASVTILEKNDCSETILADIKTDGTKALCLNIPAGGFRMPCTEETAIMKEDEYGNIRSLNNLVMRGDDVFNFVMTKVPTQIEFLLKENNMTKEELDYFVCHQPNRFMLQKLADKLEVNYEKLPNNIVEKFGNSSGATIPTNLCYNFKDELLNKTLKVCLSGFGIGLTWASMLINIGKLDFCEIIEY